MKKALALIAERVADAVCQSLGSGDAHSVVETGADGTPTAKVDMLADKAVFDTLEELGLDLNVFSEESGFTDRGGKKTLVVDPLDGTYNALTGSGPYAISLAIGTKSTDDVEEGMVKNLVTGDEYWAKKGSGAWKNDQRIMVSPYTKEDSTFSIYLGAMATERVAKLAILPRRLRYFGCIALEVCMVAEGVLDAYLVEARSTDHNVRVTDVAAATIILKEAGGMVFTADKKPFTLLFNLENRKSLLAVGDSKVLEAIEWTK
ncbi:MAG: inositol monophosphatase family protein [Candidatus Thermoplasmatota archaeon]|nr:inositol monophosphatase family protein [Candidatus Thermoplasmatota archaeon]